MTVRCAVCVNVSTRKGGPQALDFDAGEAHFVHHGHWNYVCCAEHAPLVREHGIHQAVQLLQHAANPTSGRAT